MTPREANRAKLTSAATTTLNVLLLVLTCPLWLVPLAAVMAVIGAVWAVIGTCGWLITAGLPAALLLLPAGLLVMLWRAVF